VRECWKRFGRSIRLIGSVDLTGKRSAVIENGTSAHRHIMKKTLILSLALLAGAALSARADDAKVIFEKDCAKCHGTDGKGQTKMGQKLSIKDLTDAKVQAEATDEKAFKAIKEGVKDKEGKQTMKAAEGLSDDDIKALVKHVRTFKK